VLKSPADEPLRARILQALNQDGDQVPFDDIITDCVDFLATKADCRIFSKENVHLNTEQNHCRYVGNATSTHLFKSDSHPRNSAERYSVSTITLMQRLPTSETSV
jgi:hypothetical protein